MTKIQDEIEKASKAIGDLMPSDSFYMLSGGEHRRSTFETLQTIGEAEAQIHLVAGSAVKALQIIDLSQHVSVLIYAGRLRQHYRYLLAGGDVDSLIDQLFQNLRHPDETHEFDQWESSPLVINWGDLKLITDF